jgi:hypothetical protein
MVGLSFALSLLLISLENKNSLEKSSFEDSDNIFRASLNWFSESENSVSSLAVSQSNLATTIRDNISGIIGITGIEPLEAETKVKFDKLEVLSNRVYKSDIYFNTVFKSKILDSYNYDESSLLIRSDLAKKISLDISNINSSVNVNGKEYKIIGILPESFRIDHLDIQVLLFDRDENFSDWCYTYFKLNSMSDTVGLVKNINELSLSQFDEYLKKYNSRAYYELTNLHDILFSTNKIYDGEKQSRIIMYAIIFLSISLIFMCCLMVFSIFVLDSNYSSKEITINGYFTDYRINLLLKCISIYLIISVISIGICYVVIFSIDYLGNLKSITKLNIDSIFSFNNVKLFVVILLFILANSFFVYFFIKKNAESKQTFRISFFTYNLIYALQFSILIILITILAISFLNRNMFLNDSRKALYNVYYLELENYDNINAKAVVKELVNNSNLECFSFVGKDALITSKYNFDLFEVKRDGYPLTIPLLHTHVDSGYFKVFGFLNNSKDLNVNEFRNNLYFVNADDYYKSSSFLEARVASTDTDFENVSVTKDWPFYLTGKNSRMMFSIDSLIHDKDYLFIKFKNLNSSSEQLLTSLESTLKTDARSYFDDWVYKYETKYNLYLVISFLASMIVLLGLLYYSVFIIYLNRKTFILKHIYGATMLNLIIEFERKSIIFLLSLSLISMIIFNKYQDEIDIFSERMTAKVITTLVITFLLSYSLIFIIRVVTIYRLINLNKNSILKDE